MKISYTITALCFTILLPLQAVTPESKYTRYVNPFVGATARVSEKGPGSSLGKTFPGATTPFGMVQVNPNTITGGDNGSGYSYEHRTIEGFACAQMSGIGWYGDLGNFLIMPTTGPLKKIAGKENSTTLSGYRSYYDKNSEQARPGYYSVQLTDYHIKTECSSTPHCGILRFTYPQNTQARVQIDLARRVGGTSTRQYVEVVDKHTIKGWMQCTPEGGGWGDGGGNPDYTVYFYARFSKPLKDYGFWSAPLPADWKRKREDVIGDRYQQFVSQAPVIRRKKKIEGMHLGFFTEFSTRQDEQVELKVGISFVDMAGAEKNYKAELEGKTFQQVVDEAQEAWDKALGVIEVETPSEELKKIFYTSLYHTMIDPRIISDVDGRYPGGRNKIFHSDTFRKRTIFSGWDVFRSQFPLLTIINPPVVNDMLNSLITLAEQSGTGYYDRWEFFNAYSGCMVGNPALSVLADAYIKGIRDYDVEKAFEYGVNTSKTFGFSDKNYMGGDRSISNTLEYAYADWCLGTLAGALGKQAEAARYLEQGTYYKNIYNPEIRWFQPRKEDGTWEKLPRDGRLTPDFGCAESNPYQQGWFVPHDIPGMVELMGGTEAVRNDLEHFFNSTPEHLYWNDFYNHSNEPVHHVPFLFNRIGSPWLTQKWTRHICRNAYHDAVDGLVGNDDVGQMSAWYVLASIGLHPVCPGDTRFEITSPVFDKITLHLPQHKTFTIHAPQNSADNIYIRSVTLNGEKQNRCHIDYFDIMEGGALILEMSDTPHYNLQ